MLEAKKIKLGAATKGFDDVLQRARGQAEGYARALAGRIVTVAEYMEQIKLVNAKAGEVYRYMNFDQIPEFVEQAATVEM